MRPCTRHDVPPRRLPRADGSEPRPLLDSQSSSLYLRRAKEQPRASIENSPASVEQPPRLSRAAPASVENSPASVENSPASVENSPASVENSPASVENSPASVEQPLPGEVCISLPVHHVARLVLELLIQLGIPAGVALLGLELSVQRVRVLDERDPVEVLGVWDTQALHAVRVPPLLEMALEGPRAPVRLVAADLALELEVEPVQLVKPVRDRLAIPAKGQVEWVVDWLLLVLVLVLLVHHGLLCSRGQVPLDLLVGARLLLLDHLHGLVNHLGQKISQLSRHSLKQRHIMRAAAAAAAAIGAVSNHGQFARPTMNRRLCPLPRPARKPLGAAVRLELGGQGHAVQRDRPGIPNCLTRIARLRPRLSPGLRARLPPGNLAPRPPVVERLRGLGEQLVQGHERLGLPEEVEPVVVQRPQVPPVPSRAGRGLWYGLDVGSRLEVRRIVDVLHSLQVEVELVQRVHVEVPALGLLAREGLLRRRLQHVRQQLLLVRLGRGR
eukprot:scaffold3680_cov133-Isochrysis_galbana.AAC.6